MRRISFSPPYCLCGLFTGSLTIIDTSNNLVKSEVLETDHRQYRHNRESDRTDPQITCLNGDYDGGGITAVAYGHTSNVCYTGGREGNVIVWNSTSGELSKSQVIEGEGSVVSCILNGIDEQGGDVLVTTHTDGRGTVNVYVRDKGGMYVFCRRVRLNSPVLSAGWSENNDGSKDYNRIWLGTEDGTLRQVNTQDLDTGFEVTLSNNGIRSLTVTNDSSDNDVVYLGDTEGFMYKVSVSGVEPITPPHKDALVGMALATDGVLVTASRDGTVRVWDDKGEVRMDKERMERSDS